jgi:hypothetical protein
MSPVPYAGAGSFHIDHCELKIDGFVRSPPGRHSREGGSPEDLIKDWIPASAGMTEKGVFGLFTNPSRLIPRFSFNEQRKMVNDLVAAKGLYGDSLLIKEGQEEWRHDRL